MIRAESLTKRFVRPGGVPFDAVHEVSFEVPAGEVFGLLGPNGAGKTTLLRMLAAMIRPTSGAVYIDGQPALEGGDAVRSRIGFLSGNTRLYGRLTPRELLYYFGRLFSLSDAHIADRIELLAGALDMRDFLDQRSATLSTGQTQRVSIARVMLHDPPVLILDEPTLGLDILSSAAIVGFIHDAKARGHAIIFSTHYMTEAEELCDRVGLIHQGRIAAIGTKAELFESSGTHNLREAFLATIGAADARV